MDFGQPETNNLRTLCRCKSPRKLMILRRAFSIPDTLLALLPDRNH